MARSWLEVVDLLQGIPPGRFAWTTGGQGQAWAVFHPPELSRHQQDLAAESLQRGCLKPRRKTEPLEPVDEIVGQQKEMEIRFVGEEVAGGDAA